jgi:hypothetical protein
LERSEFWHCEECGTVDLCGDCALGVESPILGTVQCTSNHYLQQYLRKKPDSYRGNVSCNLCRTSGLQSTDRPYWNCETCQFDMCNRCYTFITSKRPPFCSKDHSLVRLVNCVPVHYVARFGVSCDICGAGKLQDGGYWHCYQCRYDMCTECQHLAVASYSSNT